MVAKEIKVHPSFGTTPFFAAQDVAIEGACCSQVVNMERQVKECLHGSGSSVVFEIRYWSATQHEFGRCWQRFRMLEVCCATRYIAA